MNKIPGRPPAMKQKPRRYISGGVLHFSCRSRTSPASGSGARLPNGRISSILLQLTHLRDLPHQPQASERASQTAHHGLTQLPRFLTWQCVNDRDKPLASLPRLPRQPDCSLCCRSSVLAMAGTTSTFTMTARLLGTTWIGRTDLATASVSY